MELWTVPQVTNPGPVAPHSMTYSLMNGAIAGDAPLLRVRPRNAPSS